LTPREREVVCLIARGEKNRQIAQQLFISDRTVAVHVQNILRKLDVENRTQASAIAFQFGLCTGQ
jgi:DNA-binding NarL/FixJ family response regulator